MSENYQLGRFGEFWVSQGDLYTPTQLVPPGQAAINLQDSQKYIRLDDGSIKQNPDPVIYPAPLLLPNNTLRTGYTVSSGFEAIVVQVSGTSSPYYDLVPVDPSSITFDPSTSPQILEAPARAAGTNLRVVATNVLNLFMGPPYPTSRGADNATEYIRQVGLSKKAGIADSLFPVGTSTRGCFYRAVKQMGECPVGSSSAVFSRCSTVFVTPAAVKRHSSQSHQRPNTSISYYSCWQSCQCAQHC